MSCQMPSPRGQIWCLCTVRSTPRVFSNLRRVQKTQLINQPWKIKKAGMALNPAGPGLLWGTTRITNRRIKIILILIARLTGMILICRLCKIHRALSKMGSVCLIGCRPRCLRKELLSLCLDNLILQTVINSSHRNNNSNPKVICFKRIHYSEKTVHQILE